MSINTASQDFRAFVACAFDFHAKRMTPQHIYVDICVSMNVTPMSEKARKTRLMRTVYTAACEKRLKGRSRNYIAFRKGHEE